MAEFYALNEKEYVAAINLKTLSDVFAKPDAAIWFPVDKDATIRKVTEAEASGARM